MSVFPFTDRDFDALDINGDGILSADEIFEGLQHKYDQVRASAAHYRGTSLTRTTHPPRITPRFQV